jgi:hypothetical protein
MWCTLLSSILVVKWSGSFYFLKKTMVQIKMAMILACVGGAAALDNGYGMSLKPC